MSIPYYMPVRLFWGRDCLKNSIYPFSQLGKKALLVTGRRSAEKSGALADIKNVLKKNSVAVVHYSEVTENPEITTVQEAADLFKNEQCDFIVGIGGGSPIDAAKAVAVAVYNGLNAREVYQVDKIQGTVPLIAVPLTSGTGTEVTPFSVLSDEEKGNKAGFGHDAMFPLLSFCDPLYTLTVPPEVTRDTGLDALSHLLEGVFSAKRNPVTYPLIRQGVREILNGLETAVKNGSHEPSRTRLMMASLWGGMVIAQSGTTLQHAIGYPLTVEYGVSHGRANGLVLKQICELYEPFVSSELHKVFGLETGAIMEDVKNFSAKFDLKGDLSVDETKISSMAERVMNARNMANNPCSVKQSEIEALYRSL